VKKGYYSRSRRRAMRRGEQINHTEVFDKFGWVCHLCGQLISRYAGPEDWMRVTLDHVIPLSRGGTHTYDNVRPAHWRCNMDKGDSLPGE
jgi:5-methylcytosine-specific restriction endonuclease McrA